MTAHREEGGLTCVSDDLSASDNILGRFAGGCPSSPSAEPGRSRGVYVIGELWSVPAIDVSAVRGGAIATSSSIVTSPLWSIASSCSCWGVGGEGVVSMRKQMG